MSKQTNENGQGDKGIERREHTTRERGLKAFALLVNAVIMKCSCIGPYMNYVASFYYINEIKLCAESTLYLRSSHRTVRVAVGETEVRVFSSLDNRTNVRRVYTY